MGPMRLAVRAQGMHVVSSSAHAIELKPGSAPRTTYNSTMRQQLPRLEDTRPRRT